MAAKSLCLALGKPLITINHLHAHIYACKIASGREVFPCVGLIVSGGHTHLYRCNNALDFELLGGTIDDAAGEAFDKVASMMRLGYPGGPKISLAAESGNPRQFNFPRSFIKDDDLKFSFSGLKTSVRYELAGYGKVNFDELQLPRKKICDVAASFQAAIVDCLVKKSFQAIQQTKLQTLCVGGGVAANKVFRVTLEAEAKRRGVDLIIAPVQLCTDNAVMGAIAIEHFKQGQFSRLDADIEPGLVRL